MFAVCAPSDTVSVPPVPAWFSVKLTLVPALKLIPLMSMSSLPSRPLTMPVKWKTSSRIKWPPAPASKLVFAVEPAPNSIVPAALMIEDGAGATAAYFLAAGGAFFTAANVTRTTPVTRAQSHLSAHSALRGAIAERKVAVPRILCVGAVLSPTGGLGQIYGFRHDVCACVQSSSGICDGVDECRRAVRRQVSHGADAIKFVATGGVLSNIKAGLDQQFTDDEIRSIIETAHRLGRRVAAHAPSLSTKDAL